MTEIAKVPNVSQTDVSAITLWKALVGKAIDTVAVAWHLPNEGSPEALWSMRLSFVGGSSVVIALGEGQEGTIRYQPDTVVVIFDEARAREYRPPASSQSSFGQVIASQG